MSGPKTDALAYAEWVKYDQRFSDILVQTSPALNGHAFPRLKLQYKPSLVKASKMSQHKNKGKGPKLDLKLNLSLLPRGEPSRVMKMETDDEDDNDDDSPTRMSTSSSSGESLASPPSSCVSLENSPQATKSMVLAGCPRCLMYMMLSEDEEPKCPKCHNAVLLDFNGGSTKNSNGK